MQFFSTTDTNTTFAHWKGIIVAETYLCQKKETIIQILKKISLQNIFMSWQIFLITYMSQ